MKTHCLPPRPKKRLLPVVCAAIAVLCLAGTRCSAANPKSAGDYFESAQICLDRKDYQGAILNLTEAIGRDPADAEAWNSRAYAYFFSGDFENAIADYTETLRLEPDMGVAWVFRSQAYTQIGEHEKAAADMESLYRLVPGLRRQDK